MIHLAAFYITEKIGLITYTVSKAHGCAEVDYRRLKLKLKVNCKYFEAIKTKSCSQMFIPMYCLHLLVINFFLLLVIFT